MIKLPSLKCFRKARELVLLGRVLDELDPLLNIPLQATITRLQELLLILIRRGDDVDGLLGEEN